jgi:hypothetical protein
VWALDVEAAQPFTLELDRASEHVPGTGDYRRAPRARPRAYVFGSERVRRRRSHDLTKSSSLPFEGALRALASTWGRARLGRRPVIALPDEVQRGEHFEVRIGLPGLDRAAIEQCAVRVIGQEVGWVDTADGRRHAVELVHFDLDLARPERDGWIASFRIPPNAPPTFSGRSSDIRYNVLIECNALGAPAWRTELPLVVRP